MFELANESRLLKFEGSVLLRYNLLALFVLFYTFNIFESTPYMSTLLLSGNVAVTVFLCEV